MFIILGSESKNEEDSSISGIQESQKRIEIDEPSKIRKRRNAIESELTTLVRFKIPKISKKDPGGLPDGTDSEKPKLFTQPHNATKQFQ